MNTPQHLIAILIAAIGSAASAAAQITLTGTSYTQNFNQLASGLPSGWAVSTDATTTGLGTNVNAGFVTTTISWSAANSSGLFRNTSSDNIGSGSLAAAQNANTDRALGWRPDLAAERKGAITVAFTNTSGFENFSVSLDVFTFNDVTAVATYAFEYRVGTSGTFIQLGSTYTTDAPFSAATFSISGTTLASIANRPEPIYFRLRGTTATGTGSLDGIAIDNFTLSYSVIASPVPEPSAATTLAGLGALLSCFARRRCRHSAVRAG